MKITIQQAAEILNRTENEILFIARNENRLAIQMSKDEEIVYNSDGTVRFLDEVEQTEPEWWFELDDVLAFKKEMDEGLVGEVEGILEGK